jgi:hypothetical protein
MRSCSRRMSGRGLHRIVDRRSVRVSRLVHDVDVAVRIEQRVSRRAGWEAASRRRNPDIQTAVDVLIRPWCNPSVECL